MLARAPVRQLVARRFVAPRRYAHGGSARDGEVRLYFAPVLDVLGGHVVLTMGRSSLCDSFWLQHIPFDFSNKTTFAAKVSVYLATGFAIPFIASYYQL